MEMCATSYHAFAIRIHIFPSILSRIPYAANFSILISFKTTLFFLLVAGNFYMNSIRHTWALHKYRKLLRFKWKNLKRATFEPLKFAIAQYRILSGFYFLDCISIKFHAIIVIPFGFVCSLFSIENRKINTNNPMKYITSTCFKYIFPLVCPTCAHPIYHE